MNNGPFPISLEERNMEWTRDKETQLITKALDIIIDNQSTTNYETYFLNISYDKIKIIIFDM